MRHTSLYKTKYDMNGPWILLDKILTRIWLFKSDLYVVASSSKAESQSPIIPMKIHRVPGWAAESSVGAWPDPTFDDSRRRVNVRVRVMNLCLSIIYWHPKRILWTSLGPRGSLQQLRAKNRIKSPFNHHEHPVRLDPTKIQKKIHCPILSVSTI